MAASGTKVKVSTERLLETVKARRVKAVSDHERAVAQYEGKVEAYRSKVVDALRKAADAAEKGRLPDTGYRGQLSVPCRAQAPSKPSLSLSQIDRMIATLEMAADPTITVSAEDAARYLG